MRTPDRSGPPPEAMVAVVGAHLAGEPLNHQLTDRGARLVLTTRTAPCYRLYALDTEPARPGLVRTADARHGDPGAGAIEVEVWALGLDAFGDLVTQVPPPLCIGTVELADGSSVNGFLCEPLAVRDAADITATGGWRAHLGRSTPSGPGADRTTPVPPG